MLIIFLGLLILLVEMAARLVLRVGSRSRKQNNSQPSQWHPTPFRGTHQCLLYLLRTNSISFTKQRKRRRSNEESWVGFFLFFKRNRVRSFSFKVDSPPVKHYCHLRWLRPPNEQLFRAQRSCQQCTWAHTRTHKYTLTHSNNKDSFKMTVALHSSRLPQLGNKTAAVQQCWRALTRSLAVI